MRASAGPRRRQRRRHDHHLSRSRLPAPPGAAARRRRHRSHRCGPPPAAPLLADLFGLPDGWLRGVGAFLLGFGVAVGGVSARPVRPAVEAVVAANALWSVGGVAVVLAGLGSPTTLGAVWLLVQAVVVAAFPALQATGLRRP